MHIRDYLYTIKKIINKTTLETRDNEIDTAETVNVFGPYLINSDYSSLNTSHRSMRS